MSSKNYFILFYFLIFFCVSLSGVDYSMQLSTDGQYVDCGNSSYYDLTNNLTIEAWIYPTNFKSNRWENTIASKVDWDPSTYGWSFRYGSTSGTLEFNMSAPNNAWIDCTATNVLTLNTWQHVAATYNGSVVKIYVNGSEVATKDVSSNISITSKNLLIGAIDNSGEWRNMVGYIDQVRIWNIARSQSQISNNLTNSVTSSNLLAEFLFNTGSGTTVINSANNSYNATLVNTPSWSSNVPYYSVNIDTGNISGVNISTATKDYGNDPGTITLLNGVSETINAEKDNYLWSLATGSDSNVINNLDSNKNISFVGTFTLEDQNGFTYIGQEDVQISANQGSINNLEVPTPANTTDSDIVMVFNASYSTDLKINVPSGTWYVVAYYNDPENGGLTWHKGSAYPAIGESQVIFSNVPFASKGDVPIIISPEDTTLPVTFSSFTGFYSNENTVSLNWVTNSESGLSDYSIFRSKENDLSTAIQVGKSIFATNTPLNHTYAFEDKCLEETGTFYYWLKISEFNGSNYYHGPVIILVENNTETPAIDIPVVTKLHTAYPNPFNPSTSISYTLKDAGEVSIEIFSITGRKIWDKKLSHSNSGNYKVVWHATNKQGNSVASGIYLCKMTCNGKSWTNKLLLQK